MKNTNLKTNRLSIAVLLFVVIIVFGLITITRPDFEYKLSSAETLELVLSFEGEITPEEVEEIIWNETQGYQFVDLRYPFEFQKSHIDGAINVPLQSCLEEDRIKFFKQMQKDSIIVILYGYNQSEAVGPWMVMNQLGFDNMKILLGGYGYFSGETFDMYNESEIPQYLVEEPKYDYAGIMNSFSSGDISDVVEKPVKVIPTRKKKQSVVEGGC